MSNPYFALQVLGVEYPVIHAAAVIYGAVHWSAFGDDRFTIAGVGMAEDGKWDWCEKLTTPFVVKMAGDVLVYEPKSVIGPLEQFIKDGSSAAVVACVADFDHRNPKMGAA